MLTSPRLRQAVRRQQAIDQRLQAVGLLDDHLRVFAQLPVRVELEFEQLRRAADAAQRILDLVREVADQFAVGLRSGRAAAPRGRASAAGRSRGTRSALRRIAFQHERRGSARSQRLVPPLPRAPGPGAVSANSWSQAWSSRLARSAPLRNSDASGWRGERLERDAEKVLGRPGWRSACCRRRRAATTARAEQVQAREGGRVGMSAPVRARSPPWTPDGSSAI